jgi:hypothetical protein
VVWRCRLIETTGGHQSRTRDEGDNKRRKWVIRRVTTNRNDNVGEGNAGDDFAGDDLASDDSAGEDPAGDKPAGNDNADEVVNGDAGGGGELMKVWTTSRERGWGTGEGRED